MRGIKLSSTMEPFSFITTFFVSKQIIMMTAFTCWPPGLRTAYTKTLLLRGFSSKYIAFSCVNVNNVKNNIRHIGNVGAVPITNYLVGNYTKTKAIPLAKCACPRLTDASSELVRSAGAAGLRVRSYSEFLQAPELPARGMRREGVLIDVNCSNAASVLDKASKSRAFFYRYTWLLLHDSTLNSSFMEDLVDSLDILPDADVTWSSTDAAVDMYRVKGNQPLIVIPLEMTRNDSLEDMERTWNGMPSTVTRRQNLRNVFLKAGTVITEPHNFKGWSDLTNRESDTFPKLTYPLMMLLAQDLNYRYNLRQMDLYGKEYNGSFNGLVGMLQRQELEVGMTSMFMRADRWSALEYVAETCELKGAFIFRQPSQSSVSNVFLLPFSRGVWAACGVLLSTAAATLAALARRLHPHHRQLQVLTLPETVSFAIGTICQQGSHVTPDVTSVRVVMFSALVSSLFVFTAYSAKIVSILQTPSNALQTIDDLTRSSMSLVVQETTYKRVYFAESNEPATQRLYRRKLVPQGERAYVTVVDGVARLRTGHYAFQVEESAGYDIIRQTFTEREKCSLQQIQAFRLPMVGITLRHHSGYRELFAVRLRWQREVGLMSQARRRWLTERPRCEAGATGFLSIGLHDVLPALQILCMGVVIACLLLGAELAVHRAAHRRAATRDNNNRQNPIK